MRNEYREDDLFRELAKFPKAAIIHAVRSLCLVNVSRLTKECEWIDHQLKVKEQLQEMERCQSDREQMGECPAMGPDHVAWWRKWDENSKRFTRASEKLDKLQKDWDRRSAHA